MSWQHLRGYLGVAGVLGLMTAQAALSEDTASLPIKKIWVDNSKQVVIEFGQKAFPQVPHVLDLPGPNHRIVLDFSQASVDQASLPAADQLSTEVAKSIPFVKSVRYADLTNTAQPTARIVLDLPEAVKVKPRVVKLEEGMVTISLNEDPQTIGDASAANTTGGATPASAEAVAAAPAASKTQADAAGGQSWDWLTNGQSAQPAGATTTSAAQPTAETPASAQAPAQPAAQAVSQSQGAAPAATDSTAADLGGLKPPINIASSSTPATTEPAPQPQPEAAAQPAVSTAPAPAAPAAAPVETPATEAAPQAEAPKPEATAPQTQAEATPAADQSSTDASPVAASETPQATADTKSSAVDAVKAYNKAVQFHLTGKLPEAIAAYQAALAANPNLSEAHSNLGLIYNQQHNYAQALAEFRKALAINPKDAITYNGIGAALRAQKDLLGAIKNWQTAVSLDSHLATAHYNLGTAYEIQKEYDKAVDSYQQAVKNDYRLGEAYYRMGLIMERRHKLTEAAEEFSQSLKVSGNSEYSEDARQRLAFLSGQNKKGKK